MDYRMEDAMSSRIPGARRPNPLLPEFLDDTLPLSEIDWETVPPGLYPGEIWNGLDENVEGWVPVWFPTGDPITGRSYR